MHSKNYLYLDDEIVLLLDKKKHMNEIINIK